MLNSQSIVRKNRNQGFTLVEIVIVLVIIALLAAIAIPMWNTWIPNIQLKGAARELYANFQRAKVEALKRSTDVGISFNSVGFPTTGGSYTVFSDDGAGNAANAANSTLDTGEQVLFSTTMPQGCSLTSANFMGNASTGYNSQGFPTKVRVGSVTIRNQQSRWYRLSLTNSGYARLAMSNDGTTWH